MVLAGGVGFEAPWANGVPRPLLPLPGSSLIESLLDRLDQGQNGTCTVCAGEHSDLIGLIQARGEHLPDGRLPTVLTDDIPRGSAGCLKACEFRFRGDVILVVGAAVWLEDDLEWMLQQHLSNQNALTVFCTRGSPEVGNGTNAPLVPVGAYCCSPEVLDLIPPSGYYDLKEQLVPAIRHAGRRVGAVTLPGHTCEVSSWPTYLHVISRSLASGDFQAAGCGQPAPGIWCSSTAKIASSARIVGPAFLGHGCTVEDGATVIGPTVLGDGCHVGSNSWLIRVVAPPGTCFPANVRATDCMVALEPPAPAREPQTVSTAGEEISEVSRHAPPTIGKAQRGHPVRAAITNVLIPGVALAGMFVWAFWENFVDLWSVWQHDADYGVGQLVPLAAVYMVWTRRQHLSGLTIRPSMLGALVFTIGLLINLAGCRYLYQSLENLGLVISANGLVIGLVGWKGYKNLWYPLVFLLFMLPLPSRIHEAVTLPLQAMSARIAASVLELVGVPAERYGHVLEVAGQKTAVAEACNGLRMALAFVIVTMVVAYLINRPWWQKVVVVLSSIPIALACNVARVVTMAYLYGAGIGWVLDGPLHDGAGFLMMPLALSIIMLELWVLSNLVASAEALARPVNPIARVPATAGS